MSRAGVDCTEIDHSISLPTPPPYPPQQQKKIKMKFIELWFYPSPLRSAVASS